jgi:hypothetical protein
LALTEALNTLATAQEARETFLEEDALANEGVAELAGDNAETATEANVTDHYDNSASAVNAEFAKVQDSAGNTFDVANFGTRSASVQDAAIAAAVAQAEEDVSNAEDDAADGVLSALNSVEGRIAALEAAIAAEATAEQSFDGEVARFNIVNADQIALVSGAGELLANGDTLTLGAVTIATYNNGSWTLDQNADFVGLDADGFDDLNGFDALVADGNSWGASVVAMAEADKALTASIKKVVQLEQDDESFAVDTAAHNATVDGTIAAGADVDVTVTFGADAPEAQGVLDARVILDDLNEDVATFEAARELNDELDSLNQSIIDAREAITEEDGLDVDLLEGGDSFVGEDEVYLFNAEDSDGQSLSGFGVDGEDQIFIGDSFSRVDLADDAVFTDEQGDAATLEVFFQQDGANSVLTFEEKAFAGSGSTDADLAVVTLTGVNVDDLSIENGYITVA